MEHALEQFNRQYTDVAGVRTHYITAGSGEPVLLIHGLGSSVIAWRDNILPLAKHFKVFAVDLPGHGDTEKHAIPYDLSSGMRFLCDFMDAMGIDRAHVIGESMGGLIVMAFGLQHPERVRKVVAIGAAGLGRDLAWAIRVLTVPGLGEIISHPTMTGAKFVLHKVMATERKVSSVLIKEVYRVHAMPGAQRAMLKIVRWGVSPLGLRKRAYLLPDLPTLKAPLLLVWGKNDAIAPVKHGYQAACVLPSAKLEVFDHCGHWVQMEYSERFNTLVSDFLKPQPSA